jgi:uncharacterized membrane protein
MEIIEHFIYLIAGYLRLILEGISVFCVLIGLLQTLKEILLNRRKSRQISSFIMFSDFRLKFGVWLLLALEFQLGADIVNTTVTPSFDALGKLLLIAIVRTFLNYFLNRELTETIKMKQEELDFLQKSSNE